MLKCSDAKGDWTAGDTIIPKLDNIAQLEDVMLLCSKGMRCERILGNYMLLLAFCYGIIGTRVFFIKLNCVPSRLVIKAKIHAKLSKTQQNYDSL